MLDLAMLLRESIDFDQQVHTAKGLRWSREQSLWNAYMALDVELAEVANTSEWFKVWKEHRGKHNPGQTPHETLLEEYVDALDFFLLIFHKQQWTHLTVLTPEELDQLKQGPALDLTKTYLGIKSMVLSSLKEHRQGDFGHAWHLFLTLGLRGFDFTQDEIQNAYQAKREVNLHRQENDY
ncbi:dUTPase [Furfurilactobacillus siliginis]|uniref:2-deoxyuridine 5-triphosphate nucleotidohydrolase n=1 Tax=Furfurilactobacillus siliginis TaxID=348151 RepID=A0A0R2L0K0_9LACO|nr:dUTPase [Furfurilactobacillus siliginis]KRN95057.1 dUTPase [Furfurilactobacillus siliginis]GEK28311.1 2-deoxyuridine 5-triphosphate nucleotidohydrolase [Furfurilactobacillus siliginis]